MNFDYHVWLKKLLDFAAKYRQILVSLTVIGVLLFAVVRINVHSSTSINQERYDEQVLTIQRVKFDQDVIQQVLDLNDLNIDIDSIFPNDRNNPFN